MDYPTKTTKKKQSKLSSLKKKNLFHKFKRVINYMKVKDQQYKCHSVPGLSLDVLILMVSFTFDLNSQHSVCHLFIALSCFS